MELAAVILAAGKGTRMKSDLPKVLHRVGGRPMLGHVLRAVVGAGATNTVVVAGFGVQQVREFLGDQARVVLQEEQLGTAHALLQAEQALADFAGDLLVVCGDTPLLRASTLTGLVQAHRQTGAAATLLTAEMPDPGGYGRVIRSADGGVCRIVEQKDASPEELLVREINTGVYCFKGAGLFEALREISPANAQGEYYLTDIIQILVQRGLPVQAVSLADPQEVQGINDRLQLSRAEQVLRQRVLADLMLQGVTVMDPATTYIEQDVKIGRDTVILPFTFLQGQTEVGNCCVIGPGSRITDCLIGDGVEIQYAVLAGSRIGSHTVIGPYAYIRPGTVIGEHAKVGDFVEIKKSTIGNGSKIPHLSYVGDAVIGEKVNVGAGTITCNYDGKNKYQTVLEDGAFIGSNTNLVAPVKVGRDAVVAAGSTITKDVPAEALAVARERQTNLADWVKKKRK
ncbi:bifunctional UDP-N-acetylglucosamine diphosphorylase/glucosamine-1-phosphate N-acetyltransferase GlmU [Desulforamulus hydrothermalis]|uniref:Bifunctional protein GlmU n=1 Tax=Desulforamulus hydrothermalis Lam5 = DSM 18033 TaxID=1121428 RepID=K8DZP8_9FIRM|nr:bifunctional UDP-N-acetylglucosamine diphosphorylase/glucosamine-1-phosphate N-acetyltransferase GlmU [Desulforamulus hydrothermalis]CCO08607.1 Bifunctional protein GlmU (Includes: UDP-N-acetylglucosamine pyrophosphorylase; Glucosamine-1-phosphate N-acetyltransferase) [Desulforamulus hydrothermalis Lam5 = DSM 18033]SHH01293.1 UDP-N-acetylglucosamine pyrophosphorylase [Desulforamulus hydrothermalis Lam5 = DSM 18033]